MQASNFFKRDSNTGVFLWNLQNFWEHLFWRTFANDCFFFLNFHYHQLSCRKVLFHVLEEKQLYWRKSWFFFKYSIENFSHYLISKVHDYQTFNLCFDFWWEILLQSGKTVIRFFSMFPFDPPENIRIGKKRVKVNIGLFQLSMWLKCGMLGGWLHSQRTPGSS